MAQTTTLNGVSYSIPDPGDTGWGQSLTNFLVAIAPSVLQKTGGTFTLTAPLSFGTSFGITALSMAISGATANTVSYLDGTKTFVSSAVTPTELGYLSGVTSSLQPQIDSKAPTASPVFTGVVTLPTPFTLGATSVTATGTELNYSVGVTSPIQAQIDTKATDTLVVHLAGTETITGTKVLNSFSGTLAANIAAAGFKITGLAAGSASTDSVRFDQLNPGKILQIVSATTTTAVTSTSASYADTNLTANITPTSVSSKILVYVTQSVGAVNTALTTLRLKRDAIDLISDATGISWNVTGEINMTVPITYIDSPATVSATTYKTQFARSAGTGTALVQRNAGVPGESRIILVEIGQ